MDPKYSPDSIQPAQKRKHHPFDAYETQKSKIPCFDLSRDHYGLRSDAYSSPSFHLSTFHEILPPPYRTEIIEHDTNEQGLEDDRDTQALIDASCNNNNNTVSWTDCSQRASVHQSPAYSIDEAYHQQSGFEAPGYFDIPQDYQIDDDMPQSDQSGIFEAQQHQIRQILHIANGNMTVENFHSTNPMADVSAIDLPSQTLERSLCGSSIGDSTSIFSGERGDLYPTMNRGTSSLLDTLSQASGDAMSGSLCDELDGYTNSINYETCFGVIALDFPSTVKGLEGISAADVQLQLFGNAIKLQLSDTGKYAGLVQLPGLSKLIAESKIRFVATMRSSSAENKSKTQNRAKQKRDLQIRSYNLRIVVFGHLSDQHMVGDVLSEGGLYLQQPSHSECGMEMKYENPHYLLRPGSTMPELSEEITTETVYNINCTDTLDELSQAKLRQLFDIAHDGFISLDIAQNTYLRSSLASILASTLEEHQLSALSMMIEKESTKMDDLRYPSLWERELSSESRVSYRHIITGSIENRPLPPRGGILADEMGLGKTLSLLSLVCSTLYIQEHSGLPISKSLHMATLIITPKSTIAGWQRQIERHILPGRLQVVVFHGARRRGLAAELESCNIVLTTYETLKADWKSQGILYNRVWHRLVLDEAHHIRNRLSQTFKAACAVPSQNRWCLTGTPVHNSIDDFGALVSFCRVPKLERKCDFDYWIASPFKDKKPWSLNRLQDLVRSTCLRRTKRMTHCALKLPQRHQRVETVELHPQDQGIYNFFAKATSMLALRMQPQNGAHMPATFKNRNIVSMLSFLRLICNHGKDLLPPSVAGACNDSNDAAVGAEMIWSCKRACDACGIAIELTDPAAVECLSYNCEHSICGRCMSRSIDLDTEEGSCPKCARDEATLVATEAVCSVQGSVRYSSKLEALLRNVRTEQAMNSTSAHTQPIKSVIFTSWTKMLDIVEKAFKAEGFLCQRIDGRTSLEGRKKALQEFDANSKCTVMLASIGSAGEGVDFTSACRMHIVEPHWNPMVEAQAVDRVHRIGQTQDVTVTRYIAAKTIETYIQWVQQQKLQLVNQSFDSAYTSQSDIDNERWNVLQKYLQV